MTGGHIADPSGVTPLHPRSCPKCGADVLPLDKFCASCGDQVDRACLHCGTLLFPADRFCPECGAEDRGATAESPVDPELFWSGAIKRLRAGLLGRFRITHKLGQGGQAAVYLAEEVALQRQVAIKVLAPGSFVGDSAIERFRREAQTIASLSHPNIVTVYSVGQFEELHYFVMQYVEGRSLAAIIANRGQLPLSATRAVAFQVGSALQYAHEKKRVVHRDIKPANVLFDEEGNAILTDFGIAKDARSNTKRITDMPMGTPAYMSPEQCLERPVTWSSDQYALGVLVYEMLTGRVPFEGSNFEVMQGHTEREPPSLRHLRPDCPVEMEWAVRRMMAKTPDDRWPSMAMALQQLGATPLTREDPIRSELRRMALEESSHSDERVTPTGPMRVTIRLAEQIEPGDRLPLQAFSVIGDGARSHPIDAQWSLDNDAFAVIEGDPPVLRALAPGRSRLTAKTSLGSATADLEVVTTPVVELLVSVPRSTIEIGEVVRATAEGRDRKGFRVPADIVWRSTSPSVVTVERDGSLRGVSQGSASIVASAGGVMTQRTIFVETSVPASIALSSPPTSIATGETFVISAEVFDTRGTAIVDAPVRWSSSNSTVAPIDARGVVSARAPGTAQFTARSGVASATVAVAVQPGAETGDGGPAHATTTATPDARPPISLNGPYRVEDERPLWVERWKRPALVAAPLVLLAAVLWWALRDGSSAGASAQNPVALSARAFFSPPAVSLVHALGFAFSDSDVRDDFERGAVGSGNASNGRLTIPRPPHLYAPKAWVMTSPDFAAHFDFQFDGTGSDTRYAGLAFRSGTTPSGRRTGYVLALRGGALPSLGLLYSDGEKMTSIIALAVASLIVPGNNRVDVVVLGDKMSVYLNDGDLQVTSPSLRYSPGTQFGLFTDPGAPYSFDNFVMVGLERRE